MSLATLGRVGGRDVIGNLDLYVDFRLIIDFLIFQEALLLTVPIFTSRLQILHTPSMLLHLYHSPSLHHSSVSSTAVMAIFLFPWPSTWYTQVLKMLPFAESSFFISCNIS